jgi:hypothetical protein|tara:strand:- start:623 stop:835 length:213 start_codon:yes stop_codon:yes gene_type:complete
MHRVGGIITQHLAGDIRAFSEMKEPFVLATDGYRTLAMKGMSVCGNTAAATHPFPERAIGTAKTASGIDY